MSGIGDYVHFHTVNYIKWGINHVGNEGSSAAEAGTFSQKQRDKIDQSIINFNTGLTSLERQDLATKLTYLMRPPADAKVYAEGQSAAIYNELWSALMPFFESEFGDAVERIERATANIFSGVQIEGFKKIKIEKGQSQVYASTIQSRIDTLTNALKNPNGIYSASELSTIQKLMSQINEEKNKLVDNAKNKLAQLNANQVDSLINLDDAKDLIRAINAATIVSNGTTNLQKGTLFEYMIAVAPLVGKNVTATAIQQALLNVVGTSGKSSVVFDPKDFDANVDLESVLGSSYQLNDNLYVANHATQDKVDVQLQMSPGRTVNISAKNINLTGVNARGVHLVSGTSLLAGFASLGNNELVTHYLNQHAFGAAGMSYYAKGNMSTIYNDTADILKLSLVQKALQGYKKGVATADVFIINDNLTGTIKIFNMSDLLEKIMKTGFTENLVNIVPDIGAINIKNNFHHGSYADRITDILSQIHSYKVTIALQPGIFF